MPTMSSDTACRTRNDTASTIISTNTAPNVAEMTNPHPLSINAVGNIAPANMNIATPRLAPELTPNTYGPANGLRNSVCIINPATDIAAPVMSAVNALGKRKLYIMLLYTSLSLNNSLRGIFTLPYATSAMNNAAVTNISSMNFRFFIIILRH